MTQKTIITTIISSCISLNILASDLNDISAHLSSAVDRGAIAISATNTVNVTPEIEEMIKQINNSDLVFEKPVLIFSGDEILVNDSKRLIEALASSHATVTSLK